jgi:hypothetical protein
VVAKSGKARIASNHQLPEIFKMLDELSYRRGRAAENKVNEQ